MIRLKDGACLPGEMFPHLFKDCGIASYQVVQNADYSLRIALIQEPSQTPEQRQTLERVVRDHVRGLKVEIAYVNLIERTASGKLLPVRSHVARPTASLREGP
jgi:hypothetical protein